ncbi:MAG: choice-of-anchor Q domain-containing protein [Marinicella sp.]
MKFNRSKSVTLFFIICAALMCGFSYGATITVNGSNGVLGDADGVCTISEAIANANNNAQTWSDCVAGEAGSDTIVLTTDITLSVAYSFYTGYGGVGTPAIQSLIVLNGAGHTLERDGSCDLNGVEHSSEFRLLLILSNGNLDLQNIVLHGGCVDGVFSTAGSTFGGGIFNSGALSIINSVLDGNQAKDYGGGIYNDTGAQIIAISNSIFSNNRAEYHGGAISNKGGINNINNNSFFDNWTDTRGGGIYNYFSQNIANISNNTFSANTASYGGGFYNEGTIGNLSNSTFTNNRATNNDSRLALGGAINNEGTITVFSNSTFAGNRADDSGYGIYNNGGTISNMQNSLFTDGSSCVDYEFGGGTFNGSNNKANFNSPGCPGASHLSSTTVDSLADNGCTTPLADGSCVMTHALLLGSEALDMAVNGTVTDQRDFAVHNGTRDIGAYEAQRVEFCAANLQTDGFNTTVTDAPELIDAIECANANGSGNGGDTINLGANIMLSAEYENDATFGRTGTPVIISPIVLNGAGFSLERDSSCSLNGSSDLGEFRLFRIALNTGNLDLQNIILRGGCVDGNGGFGPIGGAIFNAGTVSIANSVLENNMARNSGGAIYNRGGTISSFNNSSLRNNTANFGAGIYNYSDAILDVISNSTLSGNVASSDGGGIYNTGTINTVSNSTFSGNSANFGGAIMNFGIVTTLSNDTFSGNNATSGGGGIVNDGSFNTIENSLFHAGSTCSSFSGTFNGSNNMADSTSGGCPGVLPTALTASTVGSLADNSCITPLAGGGCAMTHALLSGSEALDVAVGGTSNDQRGFGVYNGTRDIGAFEVHRIDFCPVGLRTDGFNINVSDDNGLIEAIECANANGATNGGDTINLSTDITLTAGYDSNATYGMTGTPAINSPIVLNGSGFVLARDNSLICNLDNSNDAGEFRLLRIASSGALDLQNIIVRNGCVDDTGFLNRSGGGIYNLGVLSIANSVINGNAAVGEGGGLQNLGTISSINDSIFSDNSASTGGGLSNDEIINTISNSIFAGNTAIFHGGSIFNLDTLNTITNSSFSDETANSFGGSIYNVGTITMLGNSTFSANTGHDGGSIYNSGTGTLNILNNSTFSGNMATNDGGGIKNFGTIDTISNSTFSNNTATNDGGGIFNSSTLTTLENSLFHNGSTCYNQFGYIFGGSNNLADDTSGGCPDELPMTLTAGTVGLLVDNGCAAPLADGTCVLTHAISSISEAIDAGNENALVFDQRGYVANGDRDIGAFEYDGQTDLIFRDGFE